MSESDYNAGWHAAQQYYDQDWEEGDPEVPPPSAWSYENTVKPKLMGEGEASRALYALRVAAMKDVGDLSLNQLKGVFEWFRVLDRAGQAGQVPEEWSQKTPTFSVENERLKERVAELEKSAHARDETVAIQMARLEAYGRYKRGMDEFFDALTEIRGRGAAVRAAARRDLG